MSSAGMNIKGKIWRLLQSPDDDQGGSVPTGMVLYDPVFSRIKSEKPTLVLLEQGIQVPEIFTAHLSYVAYSPTGTFDVRHNDQYQIDWPPISPFYGKKFIVIGIQSSSMLDNRRYLQVTLRREEYANSNDLQT
jgi:hypothetical protein